MTTITAILSLFCLPVFCVNAQGPSEHDVSGGPFGLRAGLTKSQIIQLVGRAAVKTDIGDVLTVTTVPKPHNAFEDYSLVVSPDEGLLKIIAHGNNVNTNGFGREVWEVFMDIRDVISTKYGAPKMLDGLVSGSIWRKDRDWMMALVKNERYLKALWDLQTTKPNRITVLVLKADAISEETGFLLLSYEFQGFEKYVDAKEAKAGAVF